MSLIPIVMALICLQFAKSEAMLWNETKSSSSMAISSDLMQLQQNISEKLNVSKNFANLESKSVDNFAKNFTEIKNKPNRFAKEDVGDRNFTSGEIHRANGTKMDRNLLHKNTIRNDPENHLQDPVNVKTTASTEGKSLSSKNDFSQDALIFLILSIFIVTLILSYTIYTRRSYISIQLNRDHDRSKDDKKLRYREVATEDQPMEVANSDSWGKIMLSKVGLLSCKPNSSNNSTNRRSEIDIGISRTVSIHTLSTESNNSTVAGSGIESLNGLDDEDVATDKSTNPATELRTRDCQKRICCTMNKGYDESLDTSNKMCSKCNHYRDPKIIVKRIDEVERKGSRIFIPIRLPVTIGSGKIKSIGFPKLLGNQTNTIREPCSSGIKFNCAHSTSSSSKKSGNQGQSASSSSTGNTKLKDDVSSSATCSQKQEEEQWDNVPSSSICKSKANKDCSLTEAAPEKTKTKQCHVAFKSSTAKSKENKDYPSIAAASKYAKDKRCPDVSKSSTAKSKANSDCTTSSYSGCSQYQENDQCNGTNSLSVSSTGKFKANSDCMSSSNSVCSHQKNERCNETSGSSTGKFKARDGIASSTSSDCCQQREDELCQAEFSSSTDKSKVSNDCLSRNQTASSTYTRTSKSEVRCPSTVALNYDTSTSSTSTVTPRLISEYTKSCVEKSQSQNEVQYRSNVFTCETERALYDAMDEIPRDSSSYSVSGVESSDHCSNEEVGQSVLQGTKDKISSAGCSTKSSISSCIPSAVTSTASPHKCRCDEMKSKSNSDSSLHFVKSVTKNESSGLTTPELFCVKSNQSGCKTTQTVQLGMESSICSNTPYKTPVKFKVLSTDPNYNPSTLQVKQQLKMLLQDSNSKQQSYQSNENKLQPGQVIYANLCFVKQDAINCTDSNPSCKSAASEDTKIVLKDTQKHENITPESESDLGYGASQTESGESEDTNGHCDKNKQNCSSVDEVDECYKQCVSKICDDEYPRSSFTKRLGSRFGRRGSVDTTLKTSISSDSKGNLIKSLNQRLKGTYLNQTKESPNRSKFGSSSRFSSSSRCTPVFEYAADDDCDVYEPVEEPIETGNQSTRSSVNKLLPKIRSYMSRRKKCSFSEAEQVYSEPSNDEGTTELCENCLKHVPKDISKTIRSRQSIYSDVDKFRHGGTIHLNDLIEVYPNLYPKLPPHIREALYRGMDDYSIVPYGNICDNDENVSENKCSELSSSFENISCIN